MKHLDNLNIVIQNYCEEYSLDSSGFELIIAENIPRYLTELGDLLNIADDIKQGCTLAVQNNQLLTLDSNYITSTYNLEINND